MAQIELSLYRTLIVDQLRVIIFDWWNNHGSIDIVIGSLLALKSCDV